MSDEPGGFRFKDQALTLWRRRPEKEQEQKSRKQESRSRSVVKALSWRACALVVTVSLVWLVTGEALFAASIGFIDSLIKLLVYYLHERGWNQLDFGRPAE